MQYRVIKYKKVHSKYFHFTIPTIPSMIEYSVYFKLRLIRTRKSFNAIESKTSYYSEKFYSYGLITCKDEHSYNCKLFT